MALQDGSARKPTWDVVFLASAFPDVYICSLLVLIASLREPLLEAFGFDSFLRLLSLPLLSAPICPLWVFFPAVYDECHCLCPFQLVWQGRGDIAWMEKTVGTLWIKIEMAKIHNICVKGLGSWHKRRPVKGWFYRQVLSYNCNRCEYTLKSLWIIKLYFRLSLINKKQIYLGCTKTTNFLVLNSVKGIALH